MTQNQQKDKCKREGCAGDLVLQEYICRMTVMDGNQKSISTEILEFNCEKCGMKHSFESQNADGF